jgi:hypothetical protein
MSTKKITIYDEEINEISVQTGVEKVVSIFENTQVIKLYETGPPGPKGERGESGLGEPFYYISPSLYATTSSLAFQGFLSSSLIPFSGNWFNLGSSVKQWNTLFLNDGLQLDQTKILSNIANNQQTFLIRSSSVSASFGLDGIFCVSEFSYLPVPKTGGIIKSGSDFFFGV